MKAGSVLAFGWWLLVGAGAVGCAASTDETGGDVSDIREADLTEPASFANVDMRLPKQWGIDAQGNTAVVGVLAGGFGDVQLRIETHYEKGEAGLAPTDCPREGDPPIPVKSVRDAERGFRPMGDKTAIFQRFVATCEDGSTRETRTWLLPVSKIAVIEQRRSPENDLVVRKMQVGALKDVAFENVTFHVPARWGSAGEGNERALGILAGGPRDVELALTKNFTKSIDELAPKDCHVEGDPPIPATQVRVIDKGLRQMDGAKADYREFAVTCSDGRVETHRAWVLPVSKIAIFENRATPDVEQVVANATVR